MSFNFDEKTKSPKPDHPRFRSSKFVTVEVNAGAGARLGGDTSLSRASDPRLVGTTRGFEFDTQEPNDLIKSMRNRLNSVSENFKDFYF